MCGRIVQLSHPDAIARLFATAGPPPNAPARRNAAPGQDLMAVRQHPQTGGRRLDLLRWGLIPSWATDARIAWKLINARSETAHATPAFRDAWRRRRCLVPVDAFYEWRPEGKLRQPYAIARPDRAPFALAGLWEWWKDPAGGGEVRTFTILTTQANARLAPLHHRMPVVVPPERWAAWLDPASAPPDGIAAPRPDDELEAWPVSTRVNSAANDDPGMLDPLPAGGPLQDAAR